MSPSNFALAFASLIFIPLHCLASEASGPKITRESCARELPPMREKAKKLHEDVTNAKAAYDKNPNPETEAEGVAAVLAQVDFIGPKASMEYKCKDLLPPAEATPDKP